MTTPTSSTAGLGSVAPTSKTTRPSPNHFRLGIEVTADDITKQKFTEFVLAHSRCGSTKTDTTSEKHELETTDDKLPLTDEPVFRSELEAILTAASWKPTVNEEFWMPNGSVMQMRHVLLTEEEANTIHDWFSAATDSLSNWKMPQERVTNLSKSLYKMYYKEGGSLPPDVYIDKMHRYANGGARQTARASLPSEL